MSFQMYPTPPAPEDNRPLKSRDTMAGTIYNNGDAFAHWQRLVDAGLIGNAPPMAPEIAARLAETDALFRRIAEDRRRAERSGF